jgi:hypothetical protein
VNVYLWVRRDVFQAEDLIKLVNISDLNMKPTTTVKMGFDYNQTKYFVYKSSYSIGADDYCFALYASINLIEENRIFYSNENNLNEYFRFCFEIQ